MADTNLVEVMGNPPLPTRAQPAAAMTAEQKRILKQTAGGGELSDDEFVMFLAVAARLGLDPLTKQIVATKFNNKRTQRKEMVLIVAITGMRTICQRTGLEDGTEGPEFTGDGLNWSPVWLSSDPPAAAKFVVYRKGASHPYQGVATFSEFAERYQDGNLKDFWARMPVHMLGKCAEALARRMAFADQLSGVYAPEEFGQVDSTQVIDATPSPAAEATPKAAIEGPMTDAKAVAALYNSLPKERRPSAESMKQVRDSGGMPAQIRFLISHHEGICEQPCPHLTEEIVALATPAS